MTAEESLKQAFQDYFNYLSASGEVVNVLSADPTEETNLLVFMIDIEDIFKQVQQRTTLKAKYLAKEGDVSSAVDLYAISEDEKQYFDLILKQAALKPLDALIPYSKKIHQAYLYDQGVTITDHEPAKAYVVDDHIYFGTGKEIFKCIEDTILSPEENPLAWLSQPWWIDTKGKIVYFIHHSTKFNIPSLKIINEEIYLSLIYFTLHLWYDFVNHPEEAMKNLSYYGERVSNLKRKSNHRTEPIRRNSSFF